MSLRTRLSLVTLGVSLLGLFFFGTLAYLVFVRLQNAQLEALLARELQRVQSLLENPAVEAPFLSGAGESAVLQFVNAQEQVMVPLRAEKLALRERPAFLEHEGRTLLVGSLPWRTRDLSSNDPAARRTLGTIRLGLDMSEVVAFRRTLVESMLASGLVIALLGAAFALYSVHRSLAPLRSIAARARRVDPSNPEIAPYQGPKDEVADLAEALVAALQNIRDRQHSERAFLAEVAHELAAPLTLVAAHLDGLARVQGSDPQVRAAREAAHELLHTSQDLLSLARGELERPLEHEVVALADVLARLQGEFPGLRLAVLDEGLVVGSAQRLAQVARNLVRNAVQAAGEPGKVSLHLMRRGEEVVLEVHDEGPGIAAADLPHVFDRFFSRRGGAGLGLGIARSLVQAHGGELTVFSEIGQGCCFTVTLPSLVSSLEEDAAEAGWQDAAAPAAPEPAALAPGD